MPADAEHDADVRTAQQTVFVSFPLVELPVEAAGEENGNILVARHHVAHKSRPYRSSY